MKLNAEEINFRRTIVGSVIFHIALFLIFTVKAVFFPSDIPAYVPVMKVDIVGLPGKRKPEEKVAPPAPPQKETTKLTDTKKTVEKQKVNTKDILEKFKNKANDKEKAEVKTKDILEKFKKDQVSPEPKPIAGNNVSDGTALRGLDKVVFDRYTGTVDAHVKNNWALPEWMLSLNLTAAINVKFDKDGQLIAKSFIRKSGNADFDAYVEKAIESSNPFPPPPDRLVDLLAARGITFAFPE